MEYDLFSDITMEVDTPFTDRVVCILGTFSMSTKNLLQRLRDMGADVKSSTKVSRNVHYVLIGRDAPQDQLTYLENLQFNGFCPRILHQQELDDILKGGHYAPYRVSAEIQKNLKLTFAHYEQFHVDYSTKMNPLYTSELYVASDTKTPATELYQQLGNHGIYANNYIDDTTEVFVISDATLQHLRDGVTDDTLQLIQETYNKSRSQSYRYILTSESELLQFLSAV